MLKKYKANPKTRKARNKRYYLKHRKKEISVKEAKAIQEKYSIWEREWQRKRKIEVMEQEKIEENILLKKKLEEENYESEQEEYNKSSPHVWIR